MLKQADSKGGPPQTVDITLKIGLGDGLLFLRVLPTKNFQFFLD